MYTLVARLRILGLLGVFRVVSVLGNAPRKDVKY